MCVFFRLFCCIGGNLAHYFFWNPQTLSGQDVSDMLKCDLRHKSQESTHPPPPALFYCYIFVPSGNLDKFHFCFPPKDEKKFGVFMITCTALVRTLPKVLPFWVGFFIVVTAAVVFFFFFFPFFSPGHSAQLVGILVPRPGTELNPPGPRQRAHGILTTGPPGNSLD